MIPSPFSELFAVNTLSIYKLYLSNQRKNLFHMDIWNAINASFPKIYSFSIFVCDFDKSLRKV